MAKRERRVSKQGSDYRAFEKLDDNLLPSAQELISYKEVDPTLIDFLKERAKIEQDKRHEFNSEMITLNKREQRYTHGLNYLSVICGLVVILGAMYLSYTLITLGHVLSGSIFGGIGILYVTYLFISVANKGVSPPK